MLGQLMRLFSQMLLDGRIGVGSCMNLDSFNARSANASATEAVLEIARAAHPLTCEEARVVKAKRIATKRSLLFHEPPQAAAATSSPL